MDHFFHTPKEKNGKNIKDCLHVGFGCGIMNIYNEILF
jgi:hypothetical protein